jgi:hypothetical protein
LTELSSVLQVEWEDADPIVRLQIRDGNTGAVRLESNFTLSTCGAVMEDTRNHKLPLSFTIF